MRKKQNLVLAAVILATLTLGTAIVVAEPPFPEAPVKVKQRPIEYRLIDSWMELHYTVSGSPIHAFASEAELMNFLGVEYMPQRPVELYYVSQDGIRFATEPELVAHMNELG